MDKIEAGDVLSQSTDLIAENIGKLKKIFPEIVTEEKVDFRVLREILGDNIEDEEEYYRFSWAGKSDARREAHKPSTGTLRPSKGESVNWESTQNLYLEGDNLEVLKLLQKSYVGRVKMIYIDPPYNTGKDFVYKDNYKDNLRNYQQVTGQADASGNLISTNSESEGRFHSNWLNMMYPRIILARNLLNEEGVVFISIDDNEIENLKKICNEVFGEDNFIGTFCVKSTPNARDYGHIGKMHEYCLFYGKNLHKTKTFHLPDDSKTFKYSDDIGGFNIHPLYNSNEAFHKGNRPNLHYPFYVYLNEKIDENGFYKIGLKKTPDSIEVYPPLSNRNSVPFVWRWGKDKSIDNLNKEIVGYKTSDGEFRIVQKMRTSQKVIRSMFIDKSASSRRGTAEVEKLMGGKVFSFPKPIALIKDLIQCATEGDDIVLDFFAGSSTSAHAVMQQNLEDDGHRRFIQIQLPELVEENSEAFKNGYHTIADIGKERLRRAISQISTELSESSSSCDLGFKVFKLDSSNLKNWSGSTNELQANLLDSSESIKPERTSEDVLYEVLLKYGLDLSLPMELKSIKGNSIYSIGYGALFICLDEKITSDTAQIIGEWKEELNPEVCRVVFRDNGFTDVEKTNSIQTLKRYGITEVKSI